MKRERERERERERDAEKEGNWKGDRTAEAFRSLRAEWPGKKGT